MASLQARITALAQAMGADVKALLAALNGKQGRIQDAAEKAAPADADLIGLADSSASWILKKITWANLKASLGSVFMGRTPPNTANDKTRLMADAQLGGIEAYNSGSGPGADWPVQSLTISWWNALTFGTATRAFQLVSQAFENLPGQLWFHTKHDALWSLWYRIPFTTAEKGYLVQDGGPLGYNAGSGGAVTQVTNKSTAVTLNKPCGRIVMHDASLAAGALANFTLYNSFIGAYDVVLVNATLGNVTLPSNYRCECYRASSGQCAFRVTNISAAALAEALELNFIVIKGSAT